MPRKVSPQLSEVRTRQRAHAKLRFKQRFELELNRDQIHEVELQIANGQAIFLEAKKESVKNYLVGVGGKLIAVGYNGSTHRIVTALPSEYMAALPPEDLAIARLLLLPDAAQTVINEIVNGTAALLYKQNESLAFYLVEHMGCSLRIGYNKTKNKLIPYRKKPSPIKSAASRTTPAIEHSLLAPVLALDPATSDDFRHQIRTAQSRFLWRFSRRLDFHEVTWNGQPCRVGYSLRRDVFHAFIDPPEQMIEVRSFIRLIGHPQQVIDEVVQRARDGQGEVMETLAEHRRAYRVEYGGDRYYFQYCDLDGRIEPWPGPRETSDRSSQ